MNNKMERGNNENLAETKSSHALEDPDKSSAGRFSVAVVPDSLERKSLPQTKMKTDEVRNVVWDFQEESIESPRSDSKGIPVIQILSDSDLQLDT